MKSQNIPIPQDTSWQLGQKNSLVDQFMRRPSVPEQAEKAARAIIESVRKGGDKAVFKWASEFDSASLNARNVRVSEAEFLAANQKVDAAFKKAAREAHKRIKRFAKAGLRADWKIPTPKGGFVGEKFLPFDRIGAYIPGGEAPLASTALMTVTFAQVAGVKEIIACTPCGASGEVNPYILYALKLAGATEVYRVGGVQAIAAMAYGTKSIGAVQKIVGPGNAYVTAAKKLVYGTVAIDMLAGPSEIAVLADSSASAEQVAADLLSQAEHGTGLEKSLLVTTSKQLLKRVQKELVAQTATLSRQGPICKVLKSGTLLVHVKSMAEGVKLINLFAPEHFELLVKDAARWEKQITTSGAIFIGPWTPESAGDFAAGPSHVLPTGGTSAMFSGLTVEDFRRRSSRIKLSKKDLEDVLPVIEAFGRVEGLDAHVRSAQCRLK